MKFSTALTSCLAAGAMASGPVKRDIKTIDDILSSVKSDLTKLDSAVKSFTGVQDEAPLLKASNDFIETLKSGKTKVDATGQLSLQDAVTLTQPVQDLTSVGKSLGDDLKSRRPLVEKLGECSIVRTQISSISTSSQALIKSVVSKVPQEAQDIAKKLSDGLTQLLQQSEDDFSEANCKDSSGGGGGSSPSGGSSAPAAGSTAPGSATSAPAETSAPAGSAPAGGSSAPAGTGGVVPASSSSGPSPPVVTAGAAMLAAPVGAFAALAAALAL